MRGLTSGSQGHKIRRMATENDLQFSIRDVVSADLSSIKLRLSELEGQLADLESRFETLEARRDSFEINMNRKFDELQTRLAEVRDQLQRPKSGHHREHPLRPQ